MRSNNYAGGRMILALVALLILAGCGEMPPGQVQVTATTQPSVLPPSATETLAPIMLVPPARPVRATPHEQSPALTVEPVLPEAASPTPLPPLHPLAIASMRARQYPGSDIVIERELDPGVNYERFYASYQSEGLKNYGLLTIPNGEKPASGWPVIIFNHGYIPPAEYRTTERYVAYLDILARAGYILFRPDYRGHDQSEGEARGAYGYPDYVIDVINAVASVKRMPEADPNRIGMWGHSMGGYITLRIMVITKDIKAGVIWAGVVASYPDMLTKWPRELSAQPVPPAFASSWQNLPQTYGSPDENPGFWSSISANSYLDEISGPVQLHHGTGDIEVPYEFSAMLDDQLQAEGKTVEVYTYDDDNHNISNYFNLAMLRSVDFFEKYVKIP